jgi:chemotaxis signal transduction protein
MLPHTFLLERLSDEEFWAIASQSAQAAPGGSLPQATLLVSWVFEMGTCMLPLDALQGVLPSPSHVSRLPNIPAWMSGIMAWRDEIVPVIDLEAYLRDTPCRQHAGSMLLVIGNGSSKLALRVPGANPFSWEKEQNEVAEAEAYVPTWCSPLRANAILGVREGAFVLDPGVILSDVIGQLEM